jgi:hypothetical protein
METLQVGVHIDEHLMLVNLLLLPPDALLRLARSDSYPQISPGLKPRLRRRILSRSAVVLYIVLLRERHRESL